MSWFDPFAINQIDIIDQLLWEYGWEEDIFYLERRAAYIVERRTIELETRYVNDIDYFKKMKESGDNVPLIDEPDDDFTFFFEHPQEPKKRIGKKRTILTTPQRIKIKDMLGNICINCAATKDLQIDHIDGEPSNNETHNLRLLCYSCHKARHSKQIRNDETS